MLNAIDRQNLKLAPVLEVYTCCLIILFNKLVRAIILEVKIDELYVDLVDFGRREFIRRTAVFEIPSKYIIMFEFMFLPSNKNIFYLYFIVVN